MKKLLVISVVVVIAIAGHALVSAQAENERIRQTALDYVEGWYTGDAARMERALHPDLAKRIVRFDDKWERDRVDNMSAMALVQSTRKGWGKKTPVEKQQKDVKILDVYGDIASVRAEMLGWVDYLHIGKVNGEWKIINVLWETKPEE